MRFLILSSVLILAFACGKTSTSNPIKQAQDEWHLPCLDPDGIAISCDTLRGSDGNGYDLLDSMIDVPVNVSASDITFMDNKSSEEVGRRLTCRTAVKSGDVYHYSLVGDTLELGTPAGGKFVYKRLNPGNGGDLKGVWTWNGRDNQGARVIKQITFLTGRVIWKSYCEG